MMTELDHMIHDISLERDAICAHLCDGRKICAPIEWFPVLSLASADQLQGWEITEDCKSVSWPELSEMISVEFLLAMPKREVS